MDYYHKYKKKILESHLDTFGHVNNATYLALYEEARWDLIEQNGFGLKAIQESQIGPVILRADCHFKRELYNRELIIIETAFDGLIQKKIGQFHQRMLKENGKIASTLTIDVGLFDLKERKLLDPTPEWVAAVADPRRND